MENNIFKKIFATIVVMFLVTSLVPNNKVMAKTGDVIIIGTGTDTYELGKDDLPDGLTWDASEEVLIMNGYDGDVIHDSNSPLEIEMKIKLVGENKITSHTSDRSALRFKEITIFGDDKDQDKLLINLDNSASNAIHHFSEGSIIENATVEIHAILKGDYNDLIGLMGTTTTPFNVKNGRLVVDLTMNPQKTKNLDMSGVRGGIEIRQF